MRLPIAMAVALGLLLQATLPPQAAAAAWPGDGICHAIPAAPTDTPAPGGSHDHDHCLLCFAGAIALLPPDRVPPPLGLVIPVARLVLPDAALPWAVARRPYASRAPPSIG